MIKLNHEICNCPNAVSFLRILLAPVMLWLAISGNPIWFMAVLVFSEFTDVLDGYLARRLNQITALGSQLDSWGDFAVYAVLAISAWLLWPEIVLREWYFVMLIVSSFTLPVAIGLLKFHKLTSYHTWSVKLAVAVTVIGYILLFMEWLVWPFHIAAVLCAAAAIEEIAITLISDLPPVNVRSIWYVLQTRRQGKSS